MKRNARRQSGLGSIDQESTAADPANARTYKANASTYLAKLEALAGRVIQR